MKDEVLKCIDVQKMCKSLSEAYYNRNFGVKTKSDFELLMFKFYFDAAKKLATNKDGTVNENAISDYKIGRELGLPPTKGKNLRLKMELQFETDEFNCEKELANVLSNSSNLTNENGYIGINIRSKNVFNAVRDWIEDQGDFVEITLNNNLLKVKHESLLSLVLYVLDDEEAQMLVDKLVEKAELKKPTIKRGKLETIKMVAEIGVNISEMVLNFANSFGTELCIGRIFNSLKNILNNK